MIIARLSSWVFFNFFYNNFNLAKHIFFLNMKKNLLRILAGTSAVAGIIYLAGYEYIFKAIGINLKRGPVVSHGRNKFRPFLCFKNFVGITSCK